MKLDDLMGFREIYIQTHDNPDADAIASGYGLWWYYRLRGKKVKLIYGGSRPIQKSNLLLMVDKLHVPIEHVERLDHEPDLLITVDCQYGERNIEKFSGKTIAVIDHHLDRSETLPPLHEVRSAYGACSTIVWDMLKDEGYDPADNEELATALYYGLFMDTGRMEEIRHPKDKDMRDELGPRLDADALMLLQTSNMSPEELKIAGKAMSNVDYYSAGNYALAQAQKCDPNILGVISDALIEVEGVGTCIAYCVMDDGAKISVRSCERATRANELAGYVTREIGNGGGHMRKAGGFLARDLLEKAYAAKYGNVGITNLDNVVHTILNDRLKEYFEDQDFYYAGTENVPDLSKEPVYEKLRTPIGYVKATEVYPEGTFVTVRMIEGDLPFLIKEDTYFMIGVEGEVYQNEAAYFFSHNDPTDEPYRITGEYAPTVHLAINVADFPGEAEGAKNLQDFVKTCIPKEGLRIHAKQLTKRTKVFVPWSESYVLGMPGDYIASRAEDPTNVYVVKQKILDKSYVMR